MKKWMVYGLIGALTTGLAVAEETVPWYKRIFNKNADEQTQVIPPAPVAPIAAAPTAPAPELSRPQLNPEKQAKFEKMKAQMTPEQMEKMKALRGAGDHQQFQLSPEKMEKMKAQHEELMKIGEAARNEPDPVKKEILVGQLRAKLTEIADKMQIEAKKRLEQAEKELPKLRERMIDAEKNKSTRIEEQVQRILAGEPLTPFEGKRSELPGKNKKAAKAPVAK